MPKGGASVFVFKGALTSALETMILAQNYAGAQTGTGESLPTSWCLQFSSFCYIENLVIYFNI